MQFARIVTPEENASHAKPATNTKKKTLPKTGDESLPVATLGLAGAMLLVAARKLREE